MPVTEAAAKHQIYRFTDFPQFPKTAAGVRELVKAFVECSGDESGAQAIGDLLMRKVRFCPKPAEVYEAAEAIILQSRQPSEWMPPHERKSKPCIRTSAVGLCSGCSKNSSQLHEPGVGHGLFCAKCC